jgi:hypothetical protein
MCLEIITDDEPITEGYKVFDIDNKGNLIGEVITRTRRPVNKWLDEKDYRRNKKVKTIYSHFNGSYKTGWHVFHTYSDACNWNIFKKEQRIRKVKLKYPIVTGIQHLSPVTVCKQILILPKNQQPTGCK